MCPPRVAGLWPTRDEQLHTFFTLLRPLWCPPSIRSPLSMKVWFLPALALSGFAAAAVAGCTTDGGSGQPSFYASMADASATVDAAAAASMISGYRGNNGLGAVAIDPELMRMAMDQARVMAAKDKL